MIAEYLKAFDPHQHFWEQELSGCNTAPVKQNPTFLSISEFPWQSPRQDIYLDISLSLFKVFAITWKALSGNNQMSSTIKLLAVLFFSAISYNSCNFVVGWPSVTPRVHRRHSHHSHSSTGQGRENTMKGSWVKVRTGPSLTNCCHGQNNLDSQVEFVYNLIYNQSNQSRTMGNNFLPASAWGLSHGRLSSMNISNVSPSHGLQSMNPLLQHRSHAQGTVL